ncbi:hypothetical protein ES703_52236 [subsurface metagenome]
MPVASGCWPMSVIVSMATMAEADQTGDIAGGEKEGGPGNILGNIGPD